mgnify:CR=1 FL=1
MNTTEFLTLPSLIVPERAATVFEGRRTSFAELQERVNRLANGLADLGVGAGDRVAAIQVNCPEHIEVYFAVNVVFEALVGELFRGGFIMRAGPAHNDYVTPSVISAAESDYRRNLANTLTLFNMLTSDSQRGDANKKIMMGWLEKYVPLCTEAATQLKSVWGLQSNGDLEFDSVFADAKGRFKDILSEIEVSLPDGIAL